MKTSTLMLPIAFCLAAPAAFPQMPTAPRTPIQECRSNNQYALRQNQERSNQAARAFELSTADNNTMYNERQRLGPQPGGSGNLRDCQAKSGEIARLNDRLTAMIASSDKVLAACRREARDGVIAIDVTIQNTDGRPVDAISQENWGVINNFRDKIASFRRDLDTRDAWTMALCTEQKQRVANYRAYVNGICFTDIYREGRPRTCLTVQ